VLTFLLTVVDVAVEEAAKRELGGANGEGPTVLIGFEAPDGAADVVAVDAAALLVLLFEGEVVRPSEVGRGICLDF